MPRQVFPKPYADFVQRLRVPSGIVLVAAFVFLSSPSPAGFWAGLPLVAAGLAHRTWAAGHLRKNQALTTSGPYAWHRNPLYAGTLLAALGCAAAGGGGLLLAFVAVVFLLVYLPVMQLEEQKLSELFPDYAEYARRVPQLLPKRPAAPSPERFSWDVWAMNKEWKGIAAFVVLYLFLFAKSHAAPAL
ncbi:MAG: isoprenylcysteine carboxylmethyltransferase family protein [Bryobacteraceae bacterium]|nr:isoprenylcysteine carboxylmethyltransferase family protein [Bryobacteraceae bacterium]